MNKNHNTHRSSTQRSSTPELTQNLVAWSSGDCRALHRIMPLVMDELHGMARTYLSNRGDASALEPSALVNEMYLRMAGCRVINIHERAQFFGFASHLMRIVLAEFARDRMTAKRGGEVEHIPITQSMELVENQCVQAEDALALSQALRDLKHIDPRKSSLIELHFQAGVTLRDAADLLNISYRQAKRDWQTAKGWLANRIQGPSCPLPVAS